MRVNHHAALLDFKTFAGLLACSGQDIYRKGALRRNKYLLSFPGRLAAVASAGGGKLGQLEKLNTANPELHMEFPQGRLIFHGTVAPCTSSKLLTMQCHPAAARKAAAEGAGRLGSTANPPVSVEDVFDKVIVFAEVRRGAAARTRSVLQRRRMIRYGGDHAPGECRS